MDSKIAVLLVDDHAMVRAGIRRFLEKANDIAVIAEAGSASEAQQLLQQHAPTVAVIDVKLPDMSGIELVRWLRQYYPQLRALIVTAYDDEPYLRAALRSGAKGYLLKSAAPADLIDAVRRVAKGRSVVDPSLAPLLVDMISAEPHPLTDRECEVLRLAARGKTNKEIGQHLSSAIAPFNRTSNVFIKS